MRWTGESPVRCTPPAPWASSSTPSPMIFPSASQPVRSFTPTSIIPCALLGTFCAFRLARFNVKVTSVHGYFEGLPCPTTGVIISAYVLSGAKVWNWLIVLWVLLLAFLMVSEIHYPDNKGAVLICLAFFVIATIFYWPIWAAAICAAYILFGMMNTYLNRRKGKRKAIRRKQKRAPEDIEQ